MGPMHMMRIYVQVPQQLSAGIKEGLQAELHLPQYPDKTFNATVATTSSAINTSARTLLVELHADNPDGELQPGAYAQVDFDLPSNPNVVHIPTSTLIFREHGLEVAVVGPENKIELRPAIIGRNLGTQVEVLKGLTSSDRIVNSPPDSLSNGDTVRIAGKFGGNENLARAGGETAAASEPKEH
jgi:RND family efflux transporter MFP subunit